MATNKRVYIDGRGGSRGGVQGVATPPNDFEQPLPLIYKAYYSLAQ